MRDLAWLRIRDFPYFLGEIEVPGADRTRSKTISQLLSKGGVGLKTMLAGTPYA